MLGKLAATDTEQSLKNEIRIDNTIQTTCLSDIIHLAQY